MTQLTWWSGVVAHDTQLTWWSGVVAHDTQLTWWSGVVAHDTADMVSLKGAWSGSNNPF